ncbi:MAG: DNA-3-methyladenine glycosylase family protein [Candidatus Limnocylindrales bacterium]
MRTFRERPRGPFALSDERRFFGDWLNLPSAPEAVVMAFPVEGWQGSAAVVVRQAADGVIEGAAVTSGAASPRQAWVQTLATLSLDSDGSGFPEIGARDPVLGALQARYAWLRPVCFHTPYEAAVNFVIGQRISMRQTRALRARLALELGEPLELDGQTVHAFPRPEQLGALSAFPGLPEEKLVRLRGIARAAADGELDRARLRGLPVVEALADLRRLRGVGPVAAQGILHRGAGLVDEVTDDEVTREAVMLAYNLPDRPTQADVLTIAEAWRPFRMWATVLLHVWLRRERGGPARAPVGPYSRR